MEELLDVFDINGKFLGVKSRKFCHSENPGVFHKPVWIWIKNSKGEILVQKRSMLKKQNAGKWDMPAAGHVDAGESCIEGCMRETKEELGIDAKKEDFVFLKEWVCLSEWELAQVYLLKTNMKEEDFVLQKEEVEEVRWLKYDDFVKLLYSDDFCAHDKAYKDWVVDVLK